METAAGTEKLPANAYRGTETILLVEDEESVRIFAVRALVKLGYTLLEAANGEEALAVLEKHAGPLSMVVTDLVMPKMNGMELAGRLKEIRPEVRIIFMSGYTDETVVRKRILSADSSFLQKPFTSADLAKCVRGVLDKRQPDPEPKEKLIK